MDVIGLAELWKVGRTANDSQETDEQAETSNWAFYSLN